MRGNVPAGVTLRPFENSSNTPGQHWLDRVEHVVLRHEAHLEIELIELARRTVGAGVLVAEAGGDLEIAVETGDHKQLLEHLRRLGKRVELARMHPAGHQIVARALGRACCQDRRLELGEALVDHPAAQAGNHLAAQQHVGVNLFAAQIEEAVFEADILGIVLLARHRHRQLFGARLHGHGAGINLDLAGREIGVHSPLPAPLHFAVDGDDALDPQAFQQCQRRTVGIGDDLGHAVMIAQIDEQHPAMIALAVDPARQSD